MDNLDLNKKLIAIMECCNEPVVGVAGTVPGDEGCEVEHNHANYTQTKTIGDKNISITANAENMEGIQEIIRLAGLDKDSDVDVDISISPDGGLGTALGAMPDGDGGDLSDVGPSTDDDPEAGNAVPDTDDSDDFDYAADDSESDDEYDPTPDYKDEEPESDEDDEEDDDDDEEDEPEKNSPSDYLPQKTDEQVRESIKKKLDIDWANYSK
jgi:hypothetical protein